MVVNNQHHHQLVVIVVYLLDFILLFSLLDYVVASVLISLLLAFVLLASFLLASVFIPLLSSWERTELHPPTVLGNELNFIRHSLFLGRTEKHPDVGQILKAIPLS